MKEFILAERAQRQQELDAMEQRRPILFAEIAILDQMLARWELEQKTHGETRTSQPSFVPQTGESPKGTRLSPRWRCVMAEAVRRSPRPVSHYDVASIQEAAGQDRASKEQIRSHVWQFAKDGLYEKRGPGSFVATERAATALGLVLGALTTGAEIEAPDSGELSGAPQSNVMLPLDHP
jgi:hypothetical protein